MRVLQVTRVSWNFPQLTQLNKIKNAYKCYDLVIRLSWGSEIFVRRFIVTTFLFLFLMTMFFSTVVPKAV